MSAASANGSDRGPWREFDLDRRLWTISAVRMRAGRLHRAPLSPGALAVLKTVMLWGAGEPDPAALIFPSPAAGKPLSDMAISMVVRRTNGKSDPPTWRDISGRAIVPHGFRSSFRVWAGETTTHR